MSSLRVIAKYKSSISGPLAFFKLSALESALRENCNTTNKLVLLLFTTFMFALQKEIFKNKIKTSESEVNLLKIILFKTS